MVIDDPYRLFEPNSVYRLLYERGDRAKVPVDWRRNTFPDQPQRKRCFSTAYRFVTEFHREIGDARLVHGTIWSAAEANRIDHAWIVLPSSCVFDGVVQDFFTLASFNELTNAIAEATYTRFEAEDRYLEAGQTVGPWHEAALQRVEQASRMARPIERCAFCWHSKRNHTVAGRLGPCILAGCNCPEFRPEVEP